MSEFFRQLIGKKVIVKRTRSAIRYSGKQKDTMHALGLRKINATREFNVTNSIAGMLNSVSHMIEVEVVTE